MLNVRLARLLKESSWIISSKIFSVVGTMLLVRFLTESLTPVQYGQLALGLTLAVMVNQIIIGGVSSGIARFYSVAVEKNNLNEYMLDVGYLAIASSILVFGSGVLIFFLMQWGGYGDWIGIAMLAMTLSFLNGLRSFLTAIQNSARDRSTVACHVGLEIFLRIILVVFFITFFGETVSSVMLAYILAVFFSVVSQAYFLFNKIQFDVELKKLYKDRVWAGEIIYFAWPFSAYGLFTWSQQVSDRWALKLFSMDGEVVGEYAVIFQLGYTPIAMLLGVFVTFISPILYNRSGDGKDIGRNLNVHILTLKITYLSIGVTVIIFSVLLFTHGWFFSFFVSEKYRENSYLFPWVVLAGGIFAAGQTIAVKFLSEIRSSELIYPKICTSILGIIFNFLGVYFFGLNGVVAALLMFSVIYFLWMLRVGTN